VYPEPAPARAILFIAARVPPAIDGTQAGSLYGPAYRGIDQAR
jgi:hypothetical protein